VQFPTCCMLHDSLLNGWWSPSYRCCAVLVHRALKGGDAKDAHQGHIVVYVRHPTRGWLMCNDMEVKEVRTMLSL